MWFMIVSMMLFSAFRNYAHFLGSGCGSFGRAVASDNRGPRFESSHQRNFIHLFTINCIEKTKIKKSAGNGPFF